MVWQRRFWAISGLGLTVALLMLGLATTTLAQTDPSSSTTSSTATTGAGPGYDDGGLNPTHPVDGEHRNNTAYQSPGARPPFDASRPAPLRIAFKYLQQLPESHMCLRPNQPIHTFSGHAHLCTMDNNEKLENIDREWVWLRDNVLPMLSRYLSVRLGVNRYPNTTGPLPAKSTPVGTPPPPPKEFKASDPDVLAGPRDWHNFRYMHHPLRLDDRCGFCGQHFGLVNGTRKGVMDPRLREVRPTVPEAREGMTTIPELLAGTDDLVGAELLVVFTFQPSYHWAVNLNPCQFTYDTLRSAQCPRNTKGSGVGPLNWRDRTQAPGRVSIIHVNIPLTSQYWLYSRYQEWGMWYLAHEIMHGLIMNPVYYRKFDLSFFLKRDDSKPEEDGQQQQNGGQDSTANRQFMSRSEVVQFENRTDAGWSMKVVTPRVALSVRRHFNCSTLDGAFLEEDQVDTYDGVYNAHWESRYHAMELMAVAMWSFRITELTYAFLEDSGWYATPLRVVEPVRNNSLMTPAALRYDLVDLNSFGYMAGCSFMKENCARAGDNRLQHEFCFDESMNDMNDRCSVDRMAFGPCAVRQYGSPVPDKERYFANPFIGGTSSTFLEHCPMPRTEVFCELHQACFEKMSVEASGHGTLLSGTKCRDVDCSSNVLRVQDDSGDWLHCPADGSEGFVQDAATESGRTIVCPPREVICNRLSKPMAFRSFSIFNLSAPHQHIRLAQVGPDFPTTPPEDPPAFEIDVHFTLGRELNAAEVRVEPMSILVIDVPMNFPRCTGVVGKDTNAYTAAFSDSQVNVTMTSEVVDNVHFALQGCRSTQTFPGRVFNVHRVAHVRPDLTIVAETFSEPVYIWTHITDLEIPALPHKLDKCGEDAGTTTTNNGSQPCLVEPLYDGPSDVFQIRFNIVADEAGHVEAVVANRAEYIGNATNAANTTTISFVLGHAVFEAGAPTPKPTENIQDPSPIAARETGRLVGVVTHSSQSGIILHIKAIEAFPPLTPVSITIDLYDFYNDGHRVEDDVTFACTLTEPRRCVEVVIEDDDDEGESTQPSSPAPASTPTNGGDDEFDDVPTGASRNNRRQHHHPLHITDAIVMEIIPDGATSTPTPHPNTSVAGPQRFFGLRLQFDGTDERFANNAAVHFPANSVLMWDWRIGVQFDPRVRLAATVPHADAAEIQWTSQNREYHTVHMAANASDCAKLGGSCGDFSVSIRPTLFIFFTGERDFLAEIGGSSSAGSNTIAAGISRVAFISDDGEHVLAEGRPVDALAMQRTAFMPVKGLRELCNEYRTGTTTTTTTTTSGLDAVCGQLGSETTTTTSSQATITTESPSSTTESTTTAATSTNSSNATSASNVTATTTAVAYEDDASNTTQPAGTSTNTTTDDMTTTAANSSTEAPSETTSGGNNSTASTTEAANDTATTAAAEGGNSTTTGAPGSNNATNQPTGEGTTAAPVPTYQREVTLLLVLAKTTETFDVDAFKAAIADLAEVAVEYVFILPGAKRQSRGRSFTTAEEVNLRRHASPQLLALDRHPLASHRRRRRTMREQAATITSMTVRFAFLGLVPDEQVKAAARLQDALTDTNNRNRVWVMPGTPLSITRASRDGSTTGTSPTTAAATAMPATTTASPNTKPVTTSVVEPPLTTPTAAPSTTSTPSYPHQPTAPPVYVGPDNHGTIGQRSGSGITAFQVFLIVAIAGLVFVSVFAVVKLIRKKKRKAGRSGDRYRDREGSGGPMGFDTGEGDIELGSPDDAVVDGVVVKKAAPTPASEFSFTDLFDARTSSSGGGAAGTAAGEDARTGATATVNAIPAGTKANATTTTAAAASSSTGGTLSASGALAVDDTEWGEMQSSSSSPTLPPPPGNSGKAIVSKQTSGGRAAANHFDPFDFSS